MVRALAIQKEGRGPCLLLLFRESGKLSQRVFSLSLTTGPSSYTNSLLPGNPGLYSFSFSCSHQSGSQKGLFLSQGDPEISATYTPEGSEGWHLDLKRTSHPHEKSSSLASKEGRAGSPRHGGLKESLFSRNNQEL